MHAQDILKSPQIHSMKQNPSVLNSSEADSRWMGLKTEMTFSYFLSGI